MMEVIVGKPFDRVSSKTASRQARKYFLRNGKLDYPNAQTSKTSKKYVRAMKCLEEIIPADRCGFFKQFLDMLQRIFVYNPDERLTAKEALEHPWFNEVCPAEEYEVSEEYL